MNDPKDKPDCNVYSSAFNGNAYRCSQKIVKGVDRMNNIYLLPITFHLDEIDLIIYPTLLKDNNELILIDCGYPDSVAKIEDEMNKIGLSLSQLTKIIITHHDHDHMGALREIKERYPAVEILCSKEEAPYITGQRKSLRLEQAESICNLQNYDIEKIICYHGGLYDSNVKESLKEIAESFQQ